VAGPEIGTLSSFRHADGRGRAAPGHLRLSTWTASRHVPGDGECWSGLVQEDAAGVVFVVRPSSLAVTGLRRAPGAEVVEHAGERSWVVAHVHVGPGDELEQFGAGAYGARGWPGPRSCSSAAGVGICSRLRRLAR
jgi:hypothetical protein